MAEKNVDKLESALATCTSERQQELLQLTQDLKTAAESLRELERQLTQAFNDATREQARADGLSVQNQVIC
jgi:hypothetical protein